MSELLSTLVDFAWGPALLILLIGGGLYLVVFSGFVPLKGLIHALKLVSGKFHHPNEAKAAGQLTHFQALCNALAATVGMGNIGGVAVAISQGGAGAIFWMWVAGLIGMNTKFFECTLSTGYRGKDHNGEIQGGPMYVIEQALPKVLKPLAYFFAVCGLIGTMALYQSNQLAQFGKVYFDIPNWVVGVFFTTLTLIVLLGGLKRIAAWTSRLVPTMAILYVASCLIILISQWQKLPTVFFSIFDEAFSGFALGGGLMGHAFKVMAVGIKRAAFSNEAGIGTAPMAHSNAKTSEPVSEGLVAMLGPFLDTIVVCTMTALVILSSLDLESIQNLDGVIMTSKAFEAFYGRSGIYLLAISIFLFGFSTMIGMANYNKKCWDYVFKGKIPFNDQVFLCCFCSSLIVGAVWASDDVVNLLDIGYGFMAYPNMIATIWLAPKVKKQMLTYFKKYKV